MCSICDKYCVWECVADKDMQIQAEACVAFERHANTYRVTQCIVWRLPLSWNAVCYQPVWPFKVAENALKILEGKYIFHMLPKPWPLEPLGPWAMGQPHNNLSLNAVCYLTVWLSAFFSHFPVHFAILAQFHRYYKVDWNICGIAPIFQFQLVHFPRTDILNLCIRFQHQA